MTAVMAQWLRGTSGLEKLTEEWIEDIPGCAGLFLESRQTVESAVDILGNVLRRERVRWKLVVNQGYPPAIDLKTAPVLGALQRVSLGEDRLIRLDHNQLPRWETELTAEFTVKE